MKLPTIYVCFEQLGKANPQFRAAKTTEKEAQQYCVSNSFIPKSGWWFYREYDPSKDGKILS